MLKHILQTQCTDTLLMVSPDDFGFNLETAETNDFQRNINAEEKEIRDRAMIEFNNMVRNIRSKGIRVIVASSRKDAKTPDAVFPNNWFTVRKHHQKITLTLFPMLVHNRRRERQEQTVIRLLAENNIPVENIEDFTEHEKRNIALESTGSIVFDHINMMAYASISPRTEKDLFVRYCEEINYEPVFFDTDIYHTNIMMSVGIDYAVICSDVFKQNREKEGVHEKLYGIKKDVVEITKEQMDHFCGNIIQVRNDRNELFLIMSKSAYDSFTVEQKGILEQHGTLLPSDIHTIETIGGGSARCMVAEIFFVP